MAEYNSRRNPKKKRERNQLRDKKKRRFENAGRDNEKRKRDFGLKQKHRTEFP